MEAWCRSYESNTWNVCVFPSQRNNKIIYLLREEGVVEYLVALCDDVLEAGVDPLTAVGQQDQTAHSSLDGLMTLGLTGGGLHAS